MKKFLCMSLCAVFAFGILFPVSRTSEGKSPFIEHIKKIFGYSDGIEKPKVKKGPALHGEGGSPLFEDIGEVFHYSPKDKRSPKSKKYPSKFDKALQKELRYSAEEGIK